MSVRQMTVLIDHDPAKVFHFDSGANVRRYFDAVDRFRGRVR